MLVLGQHGLVGDRRTDTDLSYLSDTILLFRFFEAHAEISTAISVVKSRTSSHERSIREFKLSSRGLDVGEALRDFEGVLSGLIEAARPFSHRHRKHSHRGFPCARHF